jgi:hypothetical protein
MQIASLNIFCDLTETESFTKAATGQRKAHLQPPEEDARSQSGVRASTDDCSWQGGRLLGAATCSAGLGRPASRRATACLKCGPRRTNHFNGDSQVY